MDGPQSPLESKLEPATITSITRWTPRGSAVVIDAASYSVVTREPAGTLIDLPEIRPGKDWSRPRTINRKSVSLTYECGWTVTPESSPGAGDAVNHVPPSVRTHGR